VPPSVSFGAAVGGDEEAPSSQPHTQSSSSGSLAQLNGGGGGLTSTTSSSSFAFSAKTASAELRPRTGRTRWFRPKAKWALLTAASTALITYWSLAPETRTLLGNLTPFAAYVTVFCSEKTVGRTLRTSADSVFGAVLGVSLAWVLGRFVHGGIPWLTGIALFLQSLLWAYSEVPVPTKRVALSTMVLVCLSSSRRSEGYYWEDALSLVGLVLLSGAFALTAAALLPLGPQMASWNAREHYETAGDAIRLLVERSVTAFCELDSRRFHVARFQLQELLLASRSASAHLAAALDDAQWEPWHGDLETMKRDLATFSSITELVGGMERALASLPFNMCHIAFAKRLHQPLQEISRAVVEVIPPRSVGNNRKGRARGADLAEARQNLQAGLAKVYKAYGDARRVLLYPEQSSQGPIVGIAFQTVAWKPNDLLHMNAFLFALLHLAAQVSAASSATAPPRLGSRRVWFVHWKSMAKTLRPPCPPKVDWPRFQSAFRFAAAICLAALIYLVPALSSHFHLAIWAPTEVTFLMFKFAGGSLRQCILRLQGALLGSVIGYVAILYVGEGRTWWLTGILTVWSFLAALGRSSPAYGYAAIVAAWTAVIVAATRVPGEEDAAAPALERMAHTVVGVACLVLAVNIVFPLWARDSALHQGVSLLARFKDLWGGLQTNWRDQSQLMLVQYDAEEEEDALLLEGDASPDSVGRNAFTNGASSGQRHLITAVEKNLALFKTMVEEAAHEPALWRAEYHPQAARQVAQAADQMCAWLRMFATCLSDLPAPLQEILEVKEPKKWLSQEWVKSLEGTSRAVRELFDSLGIALTKEPSLGAGDAYLQAIKLDALEMKVNHLLSDFSTRYDSILFGAIADSQLKILAGTESQPYVTNLDMLFYNSLVFSTKGFVSQLLACSKAVRKFVVLEAGHVDAVQLPTCAPLVLPPLELERRLQAELPALNSPTPTPTPTSPTAADDDLEPPPTAARPFGLGGGTGAVGFEDQGKIQVVLTVVGPDRIGVVHDIARIVAKHDGSISASRMVKMDGDFAVATKVSVPGERASHMDLELRATLRGLQVSSQIVRDEEILDAPYQGEVLCVCPKDSPGLLLQLTSVLVEQGLSILSLDTEVRPTTAGGKGFLMLARVGAITPIEETKLRARLAELAGGPGKMITRFRLLAGRDSMSPGSAAESETDWRLLPASGQLPELAKAAFPNNLL